MDRNLSLHDRKRIVDANYGRDFGWHVLSSSDKVLATLSDNRFEQMFWDSYSVMPIDNHTETLTSEFWFPDCHRLRNVAYPELIVDVFGHFDPKTNRVTLRGAYLRVTFHWLDKIRSPLWFAAFVWRQCHWP